MVTVEILSDPSLTETKLFCNLKESMRSVQLVFELQFDLRQH